MGLFDERVAYKPFEYPEYYTEVGYHKRKHFGYIQKYQ